MDLRTEYSNVDIDPFYIGSNACSVSEDGQLMASANFEDIVITNLATNEIIDQIDGDGELITNLILAPNGLTLGIISQSQNLRVYDVESKTIIKSFKMSSPVYVSAHDSTSSLFAFGGTDGVITVWDIEGGYVTHSLKGHGSIISSLCFYGNLNSKNWKLASGDTQGVVKIWDLTNRKNTHTFKEHASAVRGLSFTKSGQYFLSGGRDEIVVLYKDLKPIKTLVVKQSIEVAGFLDTQADSTELYFFTAGSDNLLKIWDADGETLVNQTKNYQTEEELVIVDAIQIENEQMYLVVSDQTLVKLDLSEFHTQLPVVSRIAGNHGIIADVRYVGPQFDRLALATNSPSLRIVDPQNPLSVEMLEGHRDLLNVVDVTIDGKWIATGSKDSEVRLWRYDEEVQRFKAYAVFKGHVGSVSALGLPRTPVNEYPRFLVSAAGDLTIKKWKIPKPAGDEVQVVKSSEYTRRAHDKDINSIDVSPNDEFVATASYDKLGKIWHLESGETIGVLKGHKRGLWDIKFSPYDKKIVTSSGDKTAKVWSLLNFQIEQNFESHTNAVQRAKFMNKGTQVISTGADGLIKIWDSKSGECLKTLDNHSNRIWALDIANDGLQFVTCDANGQISLFDDNSEEMGKLKEDEQKLKIENDQRLNNYISQGNFKNAILVALELNYSMKLFEIFTKIFENNQHEELIDILTQLNDVQLVSLFTKIKNWNINFKNFEVSQNLLYLMLNHLSLDKLNSSKLMAIIDSLIPYNERHLNRVENLIEESYILDYSIEQMNLLS
ncbi:U3 small nucleolar RNA-associated protein 13 [Yamadazyma tenuis]|uniref:WD40 repeat-like protein n=1 Tax=Candida tenuis (strain ATCC 10573 / BCRC 21748 / CBS 615 / JCM 9827 / NBRC 10315 / NRRL Y-1498 / VKM Y-70) TaxID=590646 RepID=G3BCL6_CANTC|nr:WD40 repeat-like protein [Yamadazyma tenuis ATCC 10573]EGV60196.1 WD40 repeat-like protein [Yamadazyma tenuis ATCC 10573]WEJ94568.1 U3 small nucleolar RNA-associated protein 13 [Yamadazyma tenuis]